jgi:Regulator of chromosome condensation (RCC1) repeat
MLAERIQCQFCVSFLQLGDGTNTNSNVPTTVEGLPRSWRRSPRGSTTPAHCCSTGAWSAGDSACALNASQQAYCWGDDSFGELG